MYELETAHCLPPRLIVVEIPIVVVLVVRVPASAPIIVVDVNSFFNVSGPRNRKIINVADTFDHFNARRAMSSGPLFFKGDSKGTNIKRARARE